MKVFLGGTCSGYDWRKTLEPQLKCDYYNPIVKNWSEADRLREVEERKTANFVLYVLTNGIKGVYSIAEVVDDSNKRPMKTIFCFLPEGMDKQMANSMQAVANLVRDNGAIVLDSLDEVATFLNERS